MTTTDLVTESVAGIDVVALPEDQGTSTVSTASAVATTAAAAPPRLAPLRNLYVTSLSYIGFTLTDGALRLVVLLYADSLGFDALLIALMFSLYELAGVFTNLFGGVAGSKYGLFAMLMSSLGLQMLCLIALMCMGPLFGDLDNDDITSDIRIQATIYVMAFECLSGVAKDLIKVAGKSTPKLVTKDGAEGRLFRLVAWITGMKNASKGAGSLLGAVMVEYIGFWQSLLVLLCILLPFVPASIIYMDKRLGQQRPAKKIVWSKVFRKGYNINVLSAARFWLFGSRDIWFEIGLPLFLTNGFGWDATWVGLFFGLYVVLYGNLQAFSTNLYKKKGADGMMGRPTPGSVTWWALACAVVPGATGTALYFTFDTNNPHDDAASIAVLCVGVLAFSALFAVNSAIHSYLIVSFSDKDVGFYYMSNAAGRLVGVLAGGIIYNYTEADFGMAVVLWVATPFLLMAALIGGFLEGGVFNRKSKQQLSSGAAVDDAEKLTQMLPVESMAPASASNIVDDGAGGTGALEAGLDSSDVKHDPLQTAAV